MEKKEHIDFKVEYPSKEELNIPNVQLLSPKYMCEYSPSNQVYSFHLPLLQQEATSIGPMYVQA